MKAGAVSLLGDFESDGVEIRIHLRHQHPLQRCLVRLVIARPPLDPRNLGGTMVGVDALLEEVEEVLLGVGALVEEHLQQVAVHIRQRHHREAADAKEEELRSGRRRSGAWREKEHRRGIIAFRSSTVVV